MSEINSFHSVWPNADYQLCYWHILCALRKQLATQKHAPAPYSAIQAQNQFDFIDYWFVPIGQRYELTGMDVSTEFYLANNLKKNVNTIIARTCCSNHSCPRNDPNAEDPPWRLTGWERGPS